MNFDNVELNMRVLFIILNINFFYKGRDCCYFYCFVFWMNLNMEKYFCLMSGGL